MSTSNDPIADLSNQLGVSWPAIEAARQRSNRMVATLSAHLQNRGASDAAFVAFGSLARGECTSKSDLDWTLLVDGPANVSQQDAATQLRTELDKLSIKPPNQGGPFGGVSSSFELVHRIGGDADANRTITQRVLLLLESKPITIDAAGRGPLVYDRVVHSVLESYLKQSAGTHSKGVPRFLLNDVVRYWRTMTVDYGAKRRERADAGWALRLLKLRTSRKLIFAAGLVTCLDYHVRVQRQGIDPDPIELLDDLVAHVKRTPLESLACVALLHPSLRPLASSLFVAYDQFLALLDDDDKRDALEKLPRDDSASVDTLFQEANRIGKDFGTAIEAFFFDATYARAMREYGVF